MDMGQRVEEASLIVSLSHCPIVSASASTRRMPPSTPPRPLARLIPVLGVLVLGSVICYGLLAVRQVLTQSRSYSYLYSNLILAWIPLVLSLLLRSFNGRPGWRRGLFLVTGALWFCFFPNSFYIVTDLVHLEEVKGGLPFWYNMMVMTSFAFAGAFLGCLALYLLHLAMRERFGFRAGWAFALGMLGLGSFGIYVGRFLRWNSWEVFTAPGKLWGDVAKLAAHPERLAGFSVTFFFFSLMAYFFVVAMARLHEGEV